MEGYGNGHVDAAMLAFLLAGLLVQVRGRTLVAGVLATLIKPLAVLALPANYPRHFLVLVPFLALAPTATAGS